MGKRAKREQRNAERRAAADAAEATRQAAAAECRAALWSRFSTELAGQRCPACGSASVAGFLYGLPRFDPALNAELDAGRVVLGGCCVCDDDPRWVCHICNYQWGRLGDSST